ncbi:hypothetical protein QQZ08_003778 [Neonectria magnoliae]|uniref:Aminoglycoside phosphotransferase domain-containing protein n=1 Tax=Neonectria magnoliae TaxID=2732573 RepID=A0ABR1IAE7_9HYPO
MSSSSWLSTAWRTVSRIFAVGQHQAATNQYPLTQEQRDSKRQPFIYSIDQDAVRALASRHNDEEPSRILASDSGSFNVCFFIEFPNSHTRWVVRIPIEPVIYDVWTKLQSEVVTMRPTTQAYLILDFFPGQPLDLQALAKDTAARRKHFYTQLLGVMAQLRQLEFATAGSLMPDHDGGPVPVIGNVLSISINELQINRSEATSPSIFSSATSFALYQHKLMSEAYRLPKSELSRQTAELELFALNHLQQLIPEIIASEWDSGPFMLSHSDLRPANIIVDDDLNIRSIIDWEWACTVPRQFFMPPSWITAQNLGYTTGMDRDKTFLEFRQVLEAKASSSGLYCQLADEWGPDLPNTLVLPLAEILQHHSNLIHIYYKCVFPQSFQKPRDEVIAGFFQDSSQRSRNHASEVQQRIINSERYTQHLKDNGLYVPDEEARQAREWLEKARQLQEKLGIDKI